MPEKLTLSLLQKTARLISIIGHPLVTLSLFSLYIAFQRLPRQNALVLSVLLLGGMVVPICWHNYRQVKRGHYTNFDVSHQGQRTQFYPILIGLLSVTTLLQFITDQPRPIWLGTLCVLALLVSAYVLNYVIKVSLHTALSFFLAWVIYSISPTGGIVMGLFALLITASRLVLRRHTVSEVIAGFLLGSVAGAGCIWLVN
ncbi:phosphatase PAP2 family protein [Spirosoma sp. KUDC1026]|uniref:phosphatase PAP2 family protein n=1 Tax=Spirosoma sp. KUDC1026 TaxID=2745947 RepID=UPI00159BB011|nr:phosphatase PAP2 family protein [Spirosoma sp. KUDC1026]QKZ11320.1 phosphatase PAP2 family protein [Spirosoma sp. KUDC1026]